MIFIKKREKSVTDNKTILEFLSSKDPTFCRVGNIYYAEKAFMVKSVFEWCTERHRVGVLTDKQANACVKTIKRFLNNELDMYWDDDTIVIRESHKGGIDASTEEYR